MMDFDELVIEEDAKPALVADEALRTVAKLAESLITGQDFVAKLEVKLSEAKARVLEIETRELPDAMRACGMTSFSLTTGQTIKVEPMVRGSIRKANLEEALLWLRNHGHGGLIKREISVALSKGNEQLGKEIVAQLNALGVEVDVADTVNPQTLGKWAREMLEDGQPFPRDLLGIFVGSRATVK